MLVRVHTLVANVNIHLYVDAVCVQTLACIVWCTVAIERLIFLKSLEFYRSKFLVVQCFYYRVQSFYSSAVFLFWSAGFLFECSVLSLSVTSHVTVDMCMHTWFLHLFIYSPHCRRRLKAFNKRPFGTLKVLFVSNMFL